MKRQIYRTRYLRIISVNNVKRWTTLLSKLETTGSLTAIFDGTVIQKRINPFYFWKGKTKSSMSCLVLLMMSAGLYNI